MKQIQNPRRTRGHRGGRRPGQQGRNTNFDSNGPDGRIRGNASQVIEKYQALGRDALLAGDRIAAENFFQHAEHYFRVMNANGAEAKAKQNTSARRGNGQADNAAGNEAASVKPPATPPSDSANDKSSDAPSASEAAAPDASLSDDTKDDKTKPGVSSAPSDEGLMRALGEEGGDDQATV